MKRPAFPDRQAAIDRARAEYAESPTALADRDWCAKCVWPVVKGNCDHCRTILRMRAHRAGRAS